MVEWPTIQVESLSEGPQRLVAELGQPVLKKTPAGNVVAICRLEALTYWMSLQAPMQASDKIALAIQQEQPWAITEAIDLAARYRWIAIPTDLSRDNRFDNPPAKTLTIPGSEPLTVLTLSDGYKRGMDLKRGAPQAPPDDMEDIQARERWFRRRQDDP